MLKHLQIHSLNPQTNNLIYIGRITDQLNIESIIKSLSSLLKRVVIKNLSNSVLSDVVANTGSLSVHEDTAIHSLLEYLKKLNEKRQHSSLHQ